MFDCRVHSSVCNNGKQRCGKISECLSHIILMYFLRFYVLFCFSLKDSNLGQNLEVQQAVVVDFFDTMTVRHAGSINKF